MIQLDEKLVKLVAQTVENIAREKGWLTYPHENEVKLVLTALYIVNKAIVEALRKVSKKHGKMVRRKSS